MTEKTMLACSAPQSTAPWSPVRTLTSSIGTVNEDSRFMNTSAARNSFHELMKANSATVTSPGTPAAGRCA